jgi:cadmium resistance protein CadD (predicted permease)
LILQVQDNLIIIRIFFGQQESKGGAWQRLLGHFIGKGQDVRGKAK